jgi:hypothetical protein
MSVVSDIYVTSFNEPLVQFCGFVFTGSGRESISDFCRNDLPAIAFVFLKSLTEALELYNFSADQPYRCQSLLRDQGLTRGSVHEISFAFNLVQYRTCKVPELRPGKKSAICFHDRSFVSFKSTSKASSSGVNLGFGPAGLAAGFGMPGFPTTDNVGFSS